MSLIYYNYGHAKLIGVDIESKDPELRDKGTGVYRKDGYITGISLSNGDLAEYYPLNHPDTTPEETAKNTKYLTEQLGKSNDKVFANGMYDLDWIVNGMGIAVSGQYHDIQIAEPLLDEYSASFSLNNLARVYLGKEKLKDEMMEYCEQQGWKLTKNKGAVTHLWKMPYSVVKGYASEDAKLTVRIIKKQFEELKEQELMDLYYMEMGLFPLLLQMRKTGVRLDIPKLNKTGMELADLKWELQEEIDTLAGFETNVGSSKDLEKLFIKQGLPVRYGEPTDLMRMKGKTRGNPSFKKQVLQKVDNQIARKILELRHITTLLNMFIGPYPELVVDGRLHCNFNLLKSDNYGTVSGRFSSSRPNLQQVSAKDVEDHIHSDSEILNGLIIRKLFLPEEGQRWLQLDWNQIEYRLIAHYAIGEGSDKIRKRYNEDPSTDYHSELMKATGIDSRKTIKTLNFGAAYGMGVRTMAANYGWDLDEAYAVYNLYHSKVPFVKETSNRVSNKAKRIGFIRTVLNRRRRLKYRDKGYVMFNGLIQGSAADIMKKAMLDAYDSGVFNILTPHLVVHDEFDVSMPNSKEGVEAGKHLAHIMETCVELKVPITAKGKVGKNWGELKDWEV